MLVGKDEGRGREICRKTTFTNDDGQAESPLLLSSKSNTKDGQR
jgi:hypothetical protein